MKTIFLNDRMVSLYFRFFFHLIIFFFLLRFLIKSHIHARGFLHVFKSLEPSFLFRNVSARVVYGTTQDCYYNKY